MDEEERKFIREYKVDIGRTLVGSVVNIMFGLLVLLFMVFYLGWVGSIEDENIVLIAMIVFCFSVIRLLSMIGQPTICYTERKNQKGGKTE